jgi:hypothetical protein
MTWPTGAVETRAHEINDDGSDTVGTIVDATDANWSYDLLERIQVKVGPDSDPATAPSHEGRLKALEALDPLLNPLTTLGDTLYGDATGTPVRLAIGTAGQIYTVVAGLPAWADAPAGGSASAITAPGDLEYGAAGSGTPTALPIGGAGQLLGIVGGLPAWLTPNYIPAPGTPQQGDVLYFDGATWTRLGAGISGQFLKTLGPSTNPVWGDISVSPPGSAIAAPAGAAQGDLLRYDGTNWVPLVPGTSGFFLKTNGSGADPTWAAPATGMANPLTTLADLIVAGVGGAPGRLGIGTAGQVLTVSAGAPAWVTPTGGAAPPDYATVLFFGGD